MSAKKPPTPPINVARAAMLNETLAAAHTIGCLLKSIEGDRFEAIVEAAYSDDTEAGLCISTYLRGCHIAIWKEIGEWLASHPARLIVNGGANAKA